MLIGLVINLLPYIGGYLRHVDPVTPSARLSSGAELELATRVQFSWIAVVSDGWLVMVEYVEMTTAFRYDRANVPVL